jgi:L-asparaginase
VTVFGLGGTIAMASHAPGGGVAHGLSPTQLLDAVPGLAETGIDLDVVDFRQVPGASVTFADIDALAGEITRRLDSTDGIVVTQGTDTIEETSYLLDLGHAGAAPIVVTGAMRNPTMAGPDGPANLLAAVRVAASPDAAGLGCLVVFADEIHAARRVRKTHTSSPATFRSPDGGPLGYVVETDVRVLNRLDHRTHVPAGGRTPTVALVTLTFDDDGVLLDGVLRLCRVSGHTAQTQDGLADRVDGVVVAALGAGHVPFRLVEPLTELAARVPVVLASRTGSGAVLSKTYGFPGSERDLLGRGLVSARYLAPTKARLLLRRLLSNDATRDQIRATFAAQ